jgi:hypothetical protein
VWETAIEPEASPILRSDVQKAEEEELQHEVGKVPSTESADADEAVLSATHPEVAQVLKPSKSCSWSSECEDLCKVPYQPQEGPRPAINL